MPELFVYYILLIVTFGIGFLIDIVFNRHFDD